MPKSVIAARQTTLRREVELAGKGVHSGAPASVVLHPAECDTGLRFLVSRRGKIVSEIAAEARSVKNLTLCTVIGDERGTNGRRIRYFGIPRRKTLGGAAVSGYLNRRPR